MTIEKKIDVGGETYHLISGPWTKDEVIIQRKNFEPKIKCHEVENESGIYLYRDSNGYKEFRATHEPKPVYPRHKSEFSRLAAAIQTDIMRRHEV